MQARTTLTPPRPKFKFKFKFYYGWVIVALVALAHMTESAEVYPVIAVLMKPMTEEFGWTRTTFTAATSVGSIVGGLAGPLVGPLVDRFGTRWILLISFTILGVMMIAQGFIQEVWQWYAVQITSRAMAQGVISLALQIVIPNWFVRRRARAIAISGFGGRIGNAITPIYVQAIINAYTWRHATVTTGFVMLALTLLPIALFMRRRPEDMGLLPDGDTPAEAASVPAATTIKPAAGTTGADEAVATIKPGPGTTGADEAAPTTATVGDVSFSVRQVLRMPSFYMLLAATVTGTLVGPAMNLHMVPYFTDRGLSPSIAVLVTTTLFLASAPGSLIGAFLVERFGIKNVTAISAFFLGLWFLFLLAVRGTLSAFIWAFTQGLLQGGSMTVRQVIFADYFGRRSLGAIRGILHPINLTFNAIGPLAAALAFDQVGNYVAIFLVFGLLRVISGLMIYFAKPPKGSAAALGGYTVGRAGGG